MNSRTSKLLSYTAIIGLSLFGVVEHAYASGGYSHRPTNIPGKSQYLRGKDIFNGKTVLRNRGNADEQVEVLEDLQRKLPAMVQKKKNLPSLAGLLSSRQFYALTNYVKRRYRIE